MRSPDCLLQCFVSSELWTSCRISSTQPDSSRNTRYCVLFGRIHCKSHFHTEYRMLHFELPREWRNSSGCLQQFIQLRMNFNDHRRAIVASYGAIIRATDDSFGARVNGFPHGSATNPAHYDGGSENRQSRA